METKIDKLEDGNKKYGGYSKNEWKNNHSKLDEKITEIDIYGLEKISDMAEDKNGWIHHFLFNCDCDYDSDCAYWFGADGSKNQIDGDRDLYDLVTGKINATNERIEPTYKLTEKGEEVLRQIRGFE